MDEPGSGGNVVRYYCTAGNGMEAFLINEVKTKLAAEDVSVSYMQQLTATSHPKKTKQKPRGLHDLKAFKRQIYGRSLCGKKRKKVIINF